MGKVFVNLDKYDNIPAVTITVTLVEIKQSGFLYWRDLLLLEVFKRGLTWGCLFGLVASNLPLYCF